MRRYDVRRQFSEAAIEDVRRKFSSEEQTRIALEGIRAE